MTNPILIELTRGGLTETVHRGALAVAGPNGTVLAQAGDVRRPIFPRSAIKALQCLQLIETGAADRFGFGHAEIALACASHSGSEQHVAMARSMLARAGQSDQALGCGRHDPMGDAELKAFLRSGATSNALHNNCSGKHAGMVCAVCHMGEALPTYLSIDHPLQKRIAADFADMTGYTIRPEGIGIDGCSAPNFAAPLADLARAFARFVTGDGLSAERRRSCVRIAAACWAKPEYVAGAGRVDTLVLSAFPGRIFIKTGAEGVYCGGVPERGLGVAIKIDDGAKRASEAVLLAVLDRMVGGVSQAARRKHEMVNWRGTVTGAVRISPDLERALDALAR